MFDLDTNVDIVITKDLLREKHSDEEYFSFYLGFNPSGNKLFKNPLRADGSVGCHFFRSRTNGELLFCDYSRSKTYTFVHVVMEKFCCNYGEALDIIANDFGIKTINKRKNEALIEFDNSVVEDNGECTIIQCETKEFSEQELAYWLKFGITLGILNKFRVYSIKHVFINGKIVRTSSRVNPIFGYYFGDKDGVQQWKIYMPFAPKGRRFYCNTRVLQGLNKIPESGEVLVITKSYKDVMSLYSCGVTAISTQGEGLILSRNEYIYLSKRFKYIIFNADWDRTGQTFMIKSLQQYDGLAFAFSNKKEYSKDFSDFIAKFGIENAMKVIDYIKELKKNGFFEEKIKYNKRKFQKTN